MEMKRRTISKNYLHFMFCAKSRLPTLSARAVAKRQLEPRHLEVHTPQQRTYHQSIHGVVFWCSGGVVRDRGKPHRVGETETCSVQRNVPTSRPCRNRNWRIPIGKALQKYEAPSFPANHRWKPVGGTVRGVEGVSLSLTVRR